jgi:hypothetical protein
VHRQKRTTIVECCFDASLLSDEQAQTIKLNAITEWAEQLRCAADIGNAPPASN